MLSGKVIVVTGGAGLLGRRFCSALAKNGGVAVVADVDAAAAERIAEEITIAGGRAEPALLDITNTA